MSEEMVDLIDENDNVVGKVTRKDVREKNLLHRGVAILVFNKNGELFVHKRTDTKDIYPGAYDMTCGGGVQAGEGYEEAAKRETTEELGIKDPKLKFLFDFRFKNDEDDVIAKTYSCLYDGKITIDPVEIVSGKFMSIEDVKELKIGRAHV